MRMLILLVVGVLLSSVAFAGPMVNPGPESVGIYQQISVNVNGTSAQALASNVYRNYLLVQNQGASTVMLKFGSQQAGTEGIQIPSGASFSPSPAPRDSVWMDVASGAVSVRVLEGVQ